ncbi:MAG: hypothetical protein ABR511_02790 [Acidimicrobiales bacterium]
MADAGPPPPPPPGSPFPSGMPRAGGAVAPETVERFGHPMRHFEVAVSAEAMALAWANLENGPHGATVTVTHEVGPRGYHGVIWTSPPTETLACALVLRPALAVESADASWLAAGLIAAEAAEAVSDRPLSLWWPDKVVTGTVGPAREMVPGQATLGPDQELVASVKTEIQLGPGRVKNVVVTMRFDVARLGLGAERRDDLLAAVVAAADSVSERLADGPAAVAAAYEARCALVGQRVKVKLRPKGETRGTVRSIDRSARLEIASPSGMIERVGVDQLMEYSVV